MQESCAGTIPGVSYKKLGNVHMADIMVVYLSILDYGMHRMLTRNLKPSRYSG